jgi:holo-[acyl-carrier protein] synthase
VQGIGIDLVEVPRIAEKIRDPKFLQRIFTPAEIEECQKLSHATQAFAARFAAKEAVGKALGTGIGGKLSWHDVEILRSESGTPTATIKSSTIKQMNKIKISLSHTENYAVAVAIIDKIKLFKGSTDVS